MRGESERERERRCASRDSSPVIAGSSGEMKKHDSHTVFCSKGRITSLSAMLVATRGIFCFVGTVHSLPPDHGTARHGIACGRLICHVGLVPAALVGGFAFLVVLF